MKKSFTFTVTFLMTSLFITNISLAQTTQSEYNYVIKGYQSQVIEEGGDMKKGYEMELLDKVQSNSGTKGTLMKMNKITDSEKKLAAYMYIYEEAGSPAKYLCIPTPNSDKALFDLYESSLTQCLIGGEGTNEIYFLSILLSKNLK